MELINNILSKLNNWCFNRWVSFGNIAGWIKSTQNNVNSGIIFCNLLLKKPSIKLKVVNNNKRIRPPRKKPIPPKLLKQKKAREAYNKALLNKQNQNQNKKKNNE